MRLNKLFTCLAFALASLALSLPSQAGMLATAQIQAGPAAIELGDSLQQRSWIQQQLVQGGVNETDAVVRVASMTDVEVAQIHQRIDEAPAGGVDGLVVVLLVLIVLEVTGYIDIIPDR
jgi:hypothetical protein